MASDEIRKKWGTIFMGEREASIEQLNAMQEPMRKEQQKKEQAEDYMERVRARAADRAREILGAAYTERQNVLQEAKNEAALIKRHALEEAARLKAEGETARKLAQTELDKARQELQNAVDIRNAAHEEGFQSGMDQAGAELQEFRGELGQALSSVLGALERQQKNLLNTWREDLVLLTQCATQAATGFVLQKEHETILRNLVMQALDLLENRSIVTVRVNPQDESQVSDMFRAARERAPELKQWIVTGDSSIEAGGLIAESGSGSVDLQRQNFRELVSNILVHLGLPDSTSGQEANAMRELVEKEVAHLASLTPEPELPERELTEPAASDLQTEEIKGENPEDTIHSQETPLLEEEESDNIVQDELVPEDFTQNPDSEQIIDETGQGIQPEADKEPRQATPAQPNPASNPSLEELEEELFPVEDAEVAQPEDVPAPPNPQVLQEGGFL